MNQLNFLSQLAEKLNNDSEFDKVIQNLETLRSRLTQSGNMVLHISTNVSRLADLYSNPSQVLSQVVPENSLSIKKR